MSTGYVSQNCTHRKAGIRTWMVTSNEQPAKVSRLGKL